MLKKFGARMCFIWHKWTCVNVYHYIDTSWDSNARSTSATYVCKRCKKSRTKDFFGAGYLTVKQLNNESSEVSANKVYNIGDWTEK